MFYKTSLYIWIMKIYSFFKFLVKTLFIYLIKFYKKCISPWLPGACRFQPTCSEYMIEAIEKHGIIYGIYLGIKRLLRCHPWGGSGFDPVPEPKKDTQSK